MDKRLKKNTENCKVKSLKSALSPPPFMLGMLFILANGWKINSLEVAHTRCYLNASDISVQRGKSPKVRIFDLASWTCRNMSRAVPWAGAWSVCCTRQQVFVKF